MGAGPRVLLGQMDVRDGEEGSGGGHAAGEEGICRGGGGSGGGSGGGGPPPEQEAGDAEEPKEPAQGLWGRSPGGGERPIEVPAAEPEATGRGRRGAEAQRQEPAGRPRRGGEGGRAGASPFTSTVLGF